MKPTVEDIAKCIDSYLSSPSNMYLAEHYPSKAAASIAEEVYALFNPVLKPLSELANNKGACLEIFNFIVGPNGRFNLVSGKVNHVNIFGSIHYSEDERSWQLVNIDIHSDGRILFRIDTSEDPIRRIFDVVDFIRSLGYDVTTETK